MVIMRLEGVHTVRKKLASGKTATYHYAWRGGPRLDGKPGSPKFIASYKQAQDNRFEMRRPTIQTLANLADAWSYSPEFDALAEKSRYEYRLCIRDLKARFGDMDIDIVSTHAVPRHFITWRDSMREHPRSADYRIATLARILAWGVDRAIIPANHATRIGKLSKAAPGASITWSDAQISLIELMRPQVRNAYKLALWTGQRRGDLLRLRWSDIGGDFLRLSQSKTGAKVSIYVCATLQGILDDCPKSGPFILTNTLGRPWSSGFNATARKDINRLNIQNVTFHDLRGTFETRAREAGCTEAECYSVTGRQLQSSQSANAYFSRTDELSRACMMKIESTFGEQSCKPAGKPVLLRKG